MKHTTYLQTINNGNNDYLRYCCVFLQNCRNQFPQYPLFYELYFLITIEFDEAIKDYLNFNLIVVKYVPTFIIR